MRPEWLEYVICWLAGHEPDTVTRGAHVWFARRPASFGDPEKTRCTRCGLTLYTRYRRQGQRVLQRRPSTP